MRYLLILLAFISFTLPCSAREVWNEEGFKLETSGWFDKELFRDWTGVQMGLTVPPNGYIVIEGKGSIELYLPCKGWVTDIGIIVIEGCNPSLDTGRDTAAYHSLCITEDNGCAEQGGRVLILVRIPKIFPTDECIPTAVRWKKGYYDVEE